MEPSNDMTQTENATDKAEIVAAEAAPVAVVTPSVADAMAGKPVARPAFNRGNRGSLRGRSPHGRGSAGGRAPRERSEFDSVTIDARRVARVMAGGRRFNFSIAVVIGDKKGRVGVGLGKAADTALAIEKATRDAKKNLITIPRTKNHSIRHAVGAKFASSTVEIRPSPGRGLVAGSAMRTVLDLGGVTDVVTKISTRSKNKLTIARATVAALRTLRS
jgi:small subunit ribosomal protein S5